MLLTEAGCLFLGFFLCVSGLQEQQTNICTLKGSSVHLDCSNKNLTSIKNWYTVHRSGNKFVRSNFPADEPRVTYKSQQSFPTLTINDLRDTDRNSYCCSSVTETPWDCWKQAVHLTVSDLQVKVVPSTEGQTVSLMCSSSCLLTENPAAYIWYKNGDFLYEDWSPWYQELVSSDSAVSYSCAIRGYQDLRAPPVSVDSVTHTCFTVTYAKGRMCSSEQTSADESCSITYPTELHVQRTLSIFSIQVTLTCKTNCPQTDAVTSLQSYNQNKVQPNNKEVTVRIPSTDRFFCTVKDHEDLNSALVCVDDQSCWRVVYASRRICALKGSSVNISCQYDYSESFKPKSNNWYQTKREMKVLTEDGGKVQFDGSKKNQHILTLRNVQKNDSAEYRFNVGEFHGYINLFGSPGVTLIVTDLEVKVTPSPEVTEGQRVTLTCSTSCPLTHNSNYMWFFNGEPLNSNNKQLILEAFSHQHAGSYSCAVRTGSNISDTSAVKTLKVQNLSPDVMYENDTAGSAEQDDHLYSRLHFSQTHSHDVYHTIPTRPAR
ncbi:uncharacterized protein LOC115391149 [Salarias fasciatus]|uniref:uncharacterized protein LOC115391149 n=1 Tax=Salarias fasciatus TaxID=181472 RepID=UPI001176BD9E|nr:uncharacterized protein LOC115391149 [Salarias fasciatus]